MEDCLKDPSRLFNMDETSFQLNPSSGKVLAKRGSRYVHSLNINSDKDCFTVLVGGKLSFLLDITYTHTTYTHKNPKILKKNIQIKFKIQ